MSAPSDREIRHVLEMYTAPDDQSLFLSHLYASHRSHEWELTAENARKGLVKLSREQGQALTYKQALAQSEEHLARLAAHSDGNSSRATHNPACLASALTGWSERRTLRQLCEAADEAERYLEQKIMIVLQNQAAWQFSSVSCETPQADDTSMYLR